MLQTVSPHFLRSLAPLGLVFALGGCGAPGGAGYTGSIATSEDEALDAFLAEARLANEDRARVDMLMGAKGGRSLSWVTADPRWVQLERSQRIGELRRLRSGFQPNSLGPGQRVRFEAERERLTRELEAMDWRGRDLLWSQAPELPGEDWLLGDARPVELEANQSLEDPALLQGWFERVEERGEFLAALERELLVRERRGFFPPAVWVKRALASVQTARDTQLPGWLGLLSTRLTEEVGLSEIDRAQWRARGAEILQVALGERLDGLANRLVSMVEQAPTGSLAGSSEDSDYYKFLLLRTTTVTTPPLEFHRLHRGQVVRIHDQIRALLAKVEPGASLESWLAEENETYPLTAVHPSSPFPSWSMGLELYESARGAELPDLVGQLNAYALSVVDTGIHASGWSREEALSYLRQNTQLDAVSASGAVDYVLLNPSSALAAPVGFEQFITIRTRCERRWGPDFDDGPLHNMIQVTGPAPLSTLGVRMLQWMRAR